MPIQWAAAVPELDTHYLDELIFVRRLQHGGSPGAPPIAGTHRVGVALNRSCVVMLSALLQGFVEEVFVDCSTHILPNLSTPAAIERYRKSFKRWGNPNANNIVELFARIGVSDVLSGLSWQKCSNTALKARLNEINEFRNQIAHGRPSLLIGGVPKPLRLELIERYRNFAATFGVTFANHVRSKLG